MKRVFLIVLDSLGIGEEPDAHLFGDHDCNTMMRISGSRFYRNVHTREMGLANIDGQEYLGPVEYPSGAVARLQEKSMGKDTTIGHWEIAGIISPNPLPTYPEGFPPEIIAAFEEATGRKVLCNKPYSGTDVIRDYGEEHMKTGALIVYTSADSVFQIAAHEEVVPLEKLYEYCRTARKIMSGKHAVGRIIARPFVGTCAADFKRTANRHDFSVEPPKETLLDAIVKAGKDVYAVGKIHDIFAGRGMTEFVYTHGNTEGLKITLEALDKEFEGLCFVNLVDFDSQYGHRQDVDGYAAAFTEFDDWLPRFTEKMREDDVLMITADHGCDPGDDHTDHTREYIPLLIYGKNVKPGSQGTKPTFAYIAATVADYLGVPFECAGAPLPVFKTPSDAEADLCRAAVRAMKNAYAPYSGYSVGAALRTADGRIFTGCNVENAAYSPGNCAERTAVFKAVSEGAKVFTGIAVAGGKNGQVEGLFPPCGVCRQVLREFADTDLPVFLVKADDPLAYEKRTLGELLPDSFGPTFIKK